MRIKTKNVYPFDRIPMSWYGIGMNMKRSFRKV